MDQKKRNKIAWVLAVVLIPVFIYLLAVNVFNVGGERDDPAPAVDEPTPATPAPPAPVEAPAPVAPPARRIETDRREADPDTLAVQREIADRVPARNPFVAVESEVSRSDVRDEFDLRVTGVVMTPGSKKSLAIIGGKMFEEGDRVGAWTIIKVNPSEVVFDDGTQRRIVGVK